MELSRMVEALGRLAPPAWAEQWDNVGLLMEPAEPRAVERVMLTIDLTEPVLEESLEAGAQLVVAYHPPIFAPLTRLTRGDAKQRIVLRAAAAGLAIYSPHTALDATPRGVNDYLAEAVGPGRVEPIQGVADETAPAAAGLGRVVTLEQAVSLEGLADRVRQHLALTHLRIATAAGHGAEANIRRVALCAGAGASVVKQCEADVYLTGEMRHHDALAAVAEGTSVILCEHSNTERPYLPRLRERLLEEVGGGLAIDVSRRDADPLRVR